MNKTVVRSPGQFCLAIGCLLSVLLAGSQTLQAQQTPSAEKLTTLVQQLGDNSFKVRERATNQLEDAGPAARQMLTAALRSPDLEIRLRARRLLALIVERDFAARLAAFLNDEDNSVDHKLPGWQRFRKALGDDTAIRRLFASMIRSEAKLLEALDSGQNLEGKFAMRARELQPYSSFNANGPRTAGTPSLATILFVASQGDAVINSDSHQLIFSILQFQGTQDTLRGSPHRKLLEKMLDGWVVQLEKANPNSYYSLMTCLSYDLKETGLRLARSHLTSKATSPSMLQYAIMALGRFGGPDDKQFLLPQLQNTSVCHTWSNPQIKKGVIRTQVRDVALVMLLEMTKQNHKAYGFELLQRNPPTVFHGHTCGFVDEEKRESAHQKWNQWFRTQQEAP